MKTITWLSLLLLSFWNSGCGMVWVTIGSGTGSGINFSFSASGVQAAYPVASDWNTFVKRANTSQLCTGAETSVGACIHGGETRQVVTYETSCANLFVTDHLNIFNWTCSIQNGVAVFNSSLQDGKGLINLVSMPASTPIWFSNYVTLVKLGSYAAVTPSAVWWNPSQLGILPDSSAAFITLGAAYNGKILTSSSASQNSYGYVITGSNVSILVLSGQVVNSKSVSGTTNNCVGATKACIFSFENTNFGWFEGQMLEAGVTNYAVLFYHSNLSHVRNLRAARFGGSGLYFDTAHYNYTNTAVVMACGGGAIGVANGNSNYFTNLNLANDLGGIYLQTANSNSFNNAQVNGSANNSISLAASFGNTFVNFTLGDNLNAPNGSLEVQSSYGNIFHSILGVNNKNAGLHLNGAFQNTFSQMALYGQSTWGVLSNAGSLRNAWFGNLQLGNNTSGNCSIAAADGLATGTCANSGSSAATYYNGFSADPFVKNVSDTTQNALNGSSVKAWNLLVDEVNFDSIYRNWVIDAAFGAASEVQCASTVSTCWVWDWSLSLTDITVYNRSNNGGGGAANNSWNTGAACISELDSSNPANVITSVGACTDGSSTTSAACTGGGGTWYPPRTYLKNAAEISNDQTGTMSGLCESGNSCVYTPNFGNYQGQTPFTSCSYKTSGALVPNIQMVGSSTPGL